MEVNIQGAPILYTIPVLGGIPITSTLVVTWAIMLLLTGLCIFLTRGLRVRNISKRQAVAEFLVATAEKFVHGNMGEQWDRYVPLVSALFALSIVSSLSSLVGVYAPTADVNGPAIIGPKTEIRHCAYIRGNAIIGEGCVIGNSCEVKNAVIFDRSQVPHFNYIGDSILGFHAHMSAGSIVSNLKSDGKNVTIRDGDRKVATNLRKFGAIIGDNVEVGCNSVLNPGTVVGKNSNIYPLARVRGLVPEKSIYKDEDNIVEKK